MKYPFYNIFRKVTFLSTTQYDMSLGKASIISSENLFAYNRMIDPKELVSKQKSNV